MKNDFDNIIRSAILDEVSGLTDSEDIFSRIKNKISTETGSKNKDYRHYIGFSFRKYVLFAVCLFVICTTATFTFSSQARAVASETISSLKNIFYVDIINNKYQIVEKPVNEAYFTYATEKTTFLSDQELGDKLGYEVKFPQLLGDGFRLESKSLGVVFLKRLTPEEYSRLEKDAYSAIDDDDMLEQLKPYNAIRDTSGLYTNSGSLSIFINISKMPILAEIESTISKHEIVQGEKIKKIKVGKLNGFWIESPNPNYPIKITDGKGSADMTVRPEIVDTFTLYWEKNDIFYTLGTFQKGFKLSLKEALKIAEDFMKVN